MGAWSAVAQFAALALVLGLLHKPLGDYMAHVYTSGRHLRVERAVYRVIGVNPDSVQTWRSYLRAVLGFSLVGLLVLYALLRLQQFLPASLGMDPMDPALSFNTAASFVTNTNWQAYSGESTLGYSAQMAGLAVQKASLRRGGPVHRRRSDPRVHSQGERHPGQLLGRSDPQHHPPAPSAGGAGRAGAAGGRCHPEFQRPAGGAHPDRAAAVDPGRAGSLPRSHQAAGHQRRRVLQRELRAPL